MKEKEKKVKIKWRSLLEFGVQLEVADRKWKNTNKPTFAFRKV